MRGEQEEMCDDDEAERNEVLGDSGKFSTKTLGPQLSA